MNMKSSTKRNGLYLKSNMDSDTFINKTIYEYYRVESRFISWKEFIKSKDLGIICVDSLNHIYKIIDEKKWLINKIKYGL